MVYALHKFKHFLMGNWFVCYVDHLALLYLIKNTCVFGKIARWILNFFEYDFSIFYKHGCSYSIANIFSCLLDVIEKIKVPYWTIYIYIYIIDFIVKGNVRLPYDQNYSNTFFTITKEKNNVEVFTLYTNLGTPRQMGEWLGTWKCLDQDKIPII
jgi:hypothetical protein